MCLLGSVTVTCQVGAEGRKCQGAFPKVFLPVPIEEVCSCRVVRAWHCCPGPVSCSCPSALQHATPNREKQTNLGVIFLSMEVSSFPPLLSFHCREGALPSSTMWASLTTCHCSFLPVSVTGSYAHSSSPGPVDAFVQKIITGISVDHFGHN